MKISAKIVALLFAMLLLGIGQYSYTQPAAFVFGKEVNTNNITSNSKKKDESIRWVNVNTAPDTWSLRNGELVCTGKPIGVMRSEKQYENFILHVEWKHMEPGGNSGVFVWSNAIPGEENRLPDGVEVQMLELDWVKLNTKDGVEPPIAYVHGELFGVGGVETVPDNPRGTRSKSIENLCKGRGEWNTYDVVCVDGVVKLSVNGKFVNGLAQATQKKGYLCLESEGAEIHFRNFSLMELPAGVTAQKSKEIFNGKDLSGWTIHGTEKWYVDKGELVCESGPDKEYGYLTTDKHYKNFILDLDFKLEANGNSGVFIRSTVDGTKVSGWQVEVAPPGHDTGGIYESYGREWLVKPSAEDQKVLKATDWNHMRIKANGDEVTSWLNGKQMVTLKDEKIGAGEGSIALQIHSGGGIKVRWKNIGIQELK